MKKTTAYFTISMAAFFFATVCAVLLITSGIARGNDLYLNVHGASNHLNTSEKFNESNPGIGLTWGNKWYGTAGTYYNSIYRKTWYLGGGYSASIFKYGDFEVKAGATAAVVTGYYISPAAIALGTLTAGTEDYRLLLGLIPSYQAWPPIVTASIQIKLL